MDTASRQNNSYRHTQGQLSFFDLPGEIRNKLYRAILIEPKTDRWAHEPELEPVCTLVPAPLLRANARMRTEALPMYYAENPFYIPGPANNDGSKWPAFLDMCATVAASGGLQLIKSLELVFHEDVEDDGWNYMVLLKFRSGRRPEEHEEDPLYRLWEDRHRIGHTETDWGDRKAVRQAFDGMLACSSSPEEIKHMEGRGIDVGRFEEALFALARHCSLVNKYVTLSIDWGH